MAAAKSRAPCAVAEAERLADMAGKDRDEEGLPEARREGHERPRREEGRVLAQERQEGHRAGSPCRAFVAPRQAEGKGNCRRAPNKSAGSRVPHGRRHSGATMNGRDPAGARRSCAGVRAAATPDICVILNPGSGKKKDAAVARADRGGAGAPSGPLRAARGAQGRQHRRRGRAGGEGRLRARWSRPAATAPSARWPAVAHDSGADAGRPADGDVQLLRPRPRPAAGGRGRGRPDRGGHHARGAGRQGQRQAVPQQRQPRHLPGDPARSARGPIGAGAGRGWPRTGRCW